MGCRWAFAALFDTLLLKPIIAMRAWESTRGDAALLGDGFPELSAFVLSRIDRYAASAPSWLVGLGALGLAKISMGSLILGALASQHPPWHPASLRRARSLWGPYFGTALIGWGAPLLGVLSLWMLLPTMGSVLLPWLGERGTDRFELAVLAIFVAGSASLNFVLDLTRAELAYGALPLRGAFQSAWRRIHTAPLWLLGVTMPRMFVGLACLLGAVDVTFIVQRRTSSISTTWLGAVFAEIAAVVASVAYLDWLRILRHRDSDRAGHEDEASS
jgi:hypothetical protein